VVSGKDGRKVSLTLAGAANLLRSIPDGDYAYSKEIENARIAWQALGDAIGASAEEAAKQAMDIASEKIWAIVSRLIDEYKLSPELLCLAGGGGSGGVVVPYLGNMKNVRWKIVKNAPIISTIGVAMAMVREVVERTVVNPTDSDMKSIRHEALEQVMKSGAKEATVEISIEYDKKTNILRATATGATELKKDGITTETVSEEDLKETAARSMRLPVQEVTEAAAAGKWHIFEGMVKSRFWGIFPTKKRFVRVIDRNGVVALQREGLGAVLTKKSKLKDDIDTLFEETASYGTIGEELPPLYAFYGEKQLDLSGLTSREQIISVLEAEFDILPEDEKIILLAVR